jgi:hypothetical protein
MSHDKNGTLIHPGDTVTIEAKVLSISGDENFCCLNVETTLPMPGNGLKSTIYALSTKQVLLVEKEKVEPEV